jgi:hypothetical protein
MLMDATSSPSATSAAMRRPELANVLGAMPDTSMRSVEKYISLSPSG